jgi:hypothetical protein
MRRCRRGNDSAKPSAGQARDESRLVTRQSVTTQANPACAAHSSTVSPRARPAPWPRALVATAAKPRNPALSGRARLVWLPDLSSAADRRADHYAVALGDEGRVAGIVKALGPLRGGGLG